MKVLRGLALVLVAGFVLAELAARFVLGLGTPPLSVAHPTIEYMFRPDQDVMRFGNRQLFNEYGMRSESLPVEANISVVLVLGDSVPNGGALTDHQDLATTRAGDARPDLFFANVSAGSWGPGNILAYLETYGSFSAETAILVFNSGDISDQPTFEPLNPASHPLEPPVSALIEGVQRYLPRYLPATFATILQPGLIPHPHSGEATGRSGAEDTERILRLFLEEGVRTCIVLHPSQQELREGAAVGMREFLNIAADFGVPVLARLIHRIGLGGVSRRLIEATWVCCERV